MKYLFLLLVTISSQTFAQSYPAEWFKPVPREGAPSWEILPQDAKPGEVILSKRNELGILSNFAATPFEYRDVKYASVEGYWQMMKFPEFQYDIRMTRDYPFTRDEVAQMTDFEAKNAGTIGTKFMKELGIDWVTFEGESMTYCSLEKGLHYKLIVDAMKAKLEQNPEVKRILLATGDLILKPDHFPSGCAAPEWAYYQVWMELRAQLKK